MNSRQLIESVPDRERSSLKFLRSAVTVGWKLAEEKIDETVSTHVNER